MKIAICELESISPYSQSRKHNEPKLDGGKESNANFEERTWQEKAHYNAAGHVFITPMAFKWSLEKAAAFLSEPIPGKGKSKYTKHFKSGILVIEGLVIPPGITRDEVRRDFGWWGHMNADGRRGSGTRVMRCFPDFPTWSGVVSYHVLDATITEDVFERYLKEAGNFIGIGRFRPENGGYYGRYKVNSIHWENA